MKNKVYSFIHLNKLNNNLKYFLLLNFCLCNSSLEFLKTTLKNWYKQINV